MKTSSARVLFAALAVATPSCSDTAAPPEPPATKTPWEITMTGTAPCGIFDAGPTADPVAGLWMNFSEVDPYPGVPGMQTVSTRMARSIDDGATWTNVGLINAAEIVVLPPPTDTIPAVWWHEVARIVYDPWTAPGAEWKMLWHRYLTVYTGAKARLFEHGWISLRTAATPDGAWSAERKLFTGFGYDTGNDVTIGPPEFPLSQLFPGSSALGDCAFFTEPGLLARPEGIYVALKCAKLSGGGIVLLRCAHDFSGVEYLGDLLDDSDAALFDPAYDGFSAPELAETASGVYLIVTPTVPPGGFYRGCMAMRVDSLATAKVARTGRVPTVVLEVNGVAGSFNGACGYSSGSTATGVIYSQYVVGGAPEFRLYASGKSLP